ncbi:hypothetical protein B0T10DRAFT_471092 [Thelonectria olida]|uniref:Uncharacterized protein n=1 Tax=Thelonectria olida TaxID=1576542 RepID=A0A9P8WIL0_9HYPO|nr:hypothetical protein B0T10DRAFT_471092 [Thelonectria olida]
MVAIHLLAGLALAATAAAEPLVTAWLPNLASPYFRLTLLGSIISSNEDATTVSVHCPARPIETTYCPMFNYMTVTYGPSTLGFIYTKYQSGSDSYTDLRLIETLGCVMYPSSAVCVDSFTDAGGEGGWSDIGTQTWTDLERYTDVNVVTISITAGAAKATTTESASTAQATPGSSGALSTLAPTAPSTTPLPTPETSSIFPNGTSHTTTSASLTEPESTSDAESTPPAITANGAHSLSAQHPGMIGIAAIVAAVVFM